MILEYLCHLNLLGQVKRWHGVIMMGWEPVSCPAQISFSAKVMVYKKRVLLIPIKYNSTNKTQNTMEYRARPFLVDLNKQTLNLIIK